MSLVKVRSQDTSHFQEKTRIGYAEVEEHGLNIAHTRSIFQQHQRGAFTLLKEGTKQMGLDISKSNDDKEHAAVFFANVVGTSDVGIGVDGTSTSGTGVKGNSTSGVGVWGESEQGEGVHGISHSITAGVAGYNDTAGAGVFGQSQNFDGVIGESHSNQHAGVTGRNTAGGMAGFFDGNVVVTGDITLTNADFAEDFDITAISEVEPGTVMVFNQYGALQPSQQAYDKRVAGVISGAGTYKPALILDKQRPSENRMPVALVGKVYCKVDASYGPIEVGDLLTTSDTPGHAMKADDPFKAFGSVIGKALHPLKAGQALLPILIALQ